MMGYITFNSITLAHASIGRALTTQLLLLLLL